MKGWWQRLMGNRIRLPIEQQLRLVSWQRLPRCSTSTPASSSRYVVVDVETSGLSLTEDKLISIGAVAVVGGKIALGDSFYVVLQQQAASEKDNILLHGIGAGEQLDGRPPAEALLDFLEFLGNSPLVAFHVTFDETMIKRAMREHLGLNMKHPWLDLAYVMPSLHPELAREYHGLDDWITHFDIKIDIRHNALADAFATAQLLQVALSQVNQKDVASFNGLRDLEKAQRWVSAVS